MGTFVLKSLVKKSVIGLSLIAILPSAAYADKTDDIVRKGKAIISSGAASQQRIDTVVEKTEKVTAKFHQQRKIVDSLKAYNDRLRRTLAAQQDAMTKLERSIEDASLIERQIVPLMTRMIDGLEKFIAVDLPFKKQEREDRVARIRSYLTNANISAAERFRQVLNAYTTENGYGQSIDVYTEELSLPSGLLTVNILQVGRAGLYYQTLDGTTSGYWDKAGKAWVALDASHNEGITTAIRIAQGKESRDLMRLPVIAPEAI